MKYLVSFLVFSLMGCAVGDPVKNVSSNQGTIQPLTNLSVTSDPPNVDCNNLNGLEILKVEEKKRTVNVLIDGKLLKVIDAPYQGDIGIQGFSLGDVKKTKNGFEISFEYGSRYYFDKRLTFTCRKGEFYLTSEHVESFDKNEPSKWTSKTLAVKSPIPLAKFDIVEYIENSH